jgi:hypothetical protein
MHLTEEHFNKLLETAAKKQAELILSSRKTEELDEKMNGHYTFRIKKWLTPLLGLLIGSGFTFIIHSKVQESTTTMQLEENVKIIKEVKDNMVGKAVFNATIGPMREDIQQIKEEQLQASKYLHDYTAYNKPTIIHHFDQQISADAPAVRRP